MNLKQIATIWVCGLLFMVSWIIYLFQFGDKEINLDVIVETFRSPIGLIPLFSVHVVIIGALLLYIFRDKPRRE